MSCLGRQALSLNLVKWAWRNAFSYPERIHWRTHDLEQEVVSHSNGTTWAFCRLCVQHVHRVTTACGIWTWPANYHVKSNLKNSLAQRGSFWRVMFQSISDAFFDLQMKWWIHKKYNAPILYLLYSGLCLFSFTRSAMTGSFCLQIQKFVSTQWDSS